MNKDGASGFCPSSAVTQGTLPLGPCPKPSWGAITAALLGDCERSRLLRFEPLIAMGVLPEGGLQGLVQVVCVTDWKGFPKI